MIYGDSWPDVENQIKNTLELFFQQKNGWYVYCTHGLDGEGWEPITIDFLKRTLDMLLKRTDTKILPAQMVLKENEK